jgi:hypothetical protein
LASRESQFVAGQAGESERTWRNVDRRCLNMFEMAMRPWTRDTGEEWTLDITEIVRRWKHDLKEKSCAMRMWTMSNSLLRFFYSLPEACVYLVSLLSVIGPSVANPCAGVTCPTVHTRGYALMQWTVH